MTGKISTVIDSNCGNLYSSMSKSGLLITAQQITPRSTGNAKNRGSHSCAPYKHNCLFTHSVLILIAPSNHFKLSLFKFLTVLTSTFCYLSQSWSSQPELQIYLENRTPGMWNFSFYRWAKSICLRLSIPFFFSVPLITVEVQFFQFLGSIP